MTIRFVDLVLIVGVFSGALLNVHAADYERHEFEFKFGGWSYHEDTLSERLIHASGDTDWQFNESHDGVGLEYNYVLSPDWRIFVGGFSMHDSYNHDALSLGAGVKYRYETDLDILSSIDVNMAVMHMQRGQLIDRSIYRVGGIAPELETHQYSIDSVSITKLLPYMTVNLFEKISFDLMALPTSKALITVDDSSNETLLRDNPVTYFVRMGIQF